MHSEVLGVGVTNGLISRSCCYEMGSPRLGWLRQRSSWLRSTWPESANPSSTSVNEGSFLNLSGICPSIVFGLVIPSRNLENFYWILNVFKGFQLRMEDQIRRLPHDVSSWSQKWIFHHRIHISEWVSIETETSKLLNIYYFENWPQYSAAEFSSPTFFSRLCLV